MKVSDDMNQFEVINTIIDYYKNLQAIKRANTCENKVLDYEIKTTQYRCIKCSIETAGKQENQHSIRIKCSLCKIIHYRGPRIFQGAR